jgi:DNA repair protein RadC
LSDMQFLDREHFKSITLNTKNIVLAIDTVSIGNLNSSPVHPRELFKLPIKRSGAAVIVSHNHPSGDPTPSKEDIEVTKRLAEAGKLLGIDIYDHIIIGSQKYVSLKEQGII